MKFTSQKGFTGPTTITVVILFILFGAMYYYSVKYPTNPEAQVDGDSSMVQQ